MSSMSLLILLKKFAEQNTEIVGSFERFVKGWRILVWCFAACHLWQPSQFSSSELI